MSRAKKEHEIVDARAVHSTALERAHEFDRATASTYDLVLSTTVASALESEQAQSKLRHLMRYLDAIEAERKTITGPLWQAWKATNAFFDPAKKRGEEMSRHLREAIGSYERSVQQVRAQAMREQAAGAPPPLIPLPQNAEKVEGVSVRTIWKWRIVNPDAVDRGLCSPDPTKIERAIGDTANTTRAIVSGVEWYEDSQLSVRR